MELLWDMRVSLDLFLGGLGIGAFLVGTLCYYLDARAYSNLIKSAFIVAPISVTAGLILLLTELGRPFAVVKAISSVNPASLMSIGIFLQGAFILISLFLLLRVVALGAESVSRVLVYANAVLAGLVGFYHGFLLTSINLEPWNNAIPIIFLISSVLAGFAFIFLIHPGHLEDLAAKFKLPVIVNSILTLELAAVFAWVYNLSLTTSTSKDAYSVLMTSFGTQFWGLSILVGLVAPLLLFTLVLSGKVSLKAVFIPASVAIITGSFFLKNLVVYLGQAV